MTTVFYNPDKTWTELSLNSNFQKFMKEYFNLMQRRLKKIEVKGNSNSYSYYTCDQPHSRRNPEWKPFKFLWRLCKKYGYDQFIVKDLIEEKIGNTLVCECQILIDQKAIRRQHLEKTFGIDFGEPGNRHLDVI
jgi:hypothetical protein